MSRGPYLAKRILLSVIAAVGTLLLVLVIAVTFLNPGTVTGPSVVATSTWLIFFVPALICIWFKRRMSAFAKVELWLRASILGLLTYLGVDWLAERALSSGYTAFGVRLAVHKEEVGVVASSLITLLAIRRKGRDDHGAASIEHGA